jgi:hypothetical protein
MDEKVLSSVREQIRRINEYKSELETKNGNAIGDYHRARKAQTDAKEECTISG